MSEHECGPFHKTRTNSLYGCNCWHSLASVICVHDFFLQKSLFTILILATPMILVIEVLHIDGARQQNFELSSSFMR
jgi:hypothetical protein